MQKPICYLCKGEIDPIDLTVREVVTSTRRLSKEPESAEGVGCIGCLPGCLPGMFMAGRSATAEREEHREKQAFHKECWRKYESKPGCLRRLVITGFELILLVVFLYLLFWLGAVVISRA